MTIRPLKVSPDSLEAVQQHLSDVVGRSEFAERALGGGSPSEVELSAAHEVYSPGVDELAKGRGLSNAEPVAKEFLVMQGPSAIASVEENAAGGGVSSTEGPFAEATARAIQAAEQDPDLSDGEYELRVLRVPGLYLVAVWLKDLNGDGDVVIPLPPSPAPLEAGKTYHLEELEPILEGMSRQRLDFEGA